MIKKMHFKSMPRAAFTLVEVMVSMVVLAIMMMLIAQIIGATQRSWRSASSRLSQFREARIAFDTITRNLKQATLNSYRDFYYTATGSNVPATGTPGESPDSYRRISELAFVCGQAESVVHGDVRKEDLSGHAVFFQAPLGVTDPTDPDQKKDKGRPAYENLKHLLCGRGYFVLFGDDMDYMPENLKSRLTPTQRFRLMEYQPPAEKNTVYASDDTWYEVDADYLRPVSDKIVGLILSPRLSAGNDSVMINGNNVNPDSIAPDYTYDSRKVKLATTQDVQGVQHVLPPVMRVTMVALDDASMQQIVEDRNDKVKVEDIKKEIGNFNRADNYESDLENLKNLLNSGKVNYRIFESTIVLPASGTR